MAFTTTLSTRYWLKTLIMAVVCIVLGLWGVWDYVIVIPEKEEASRRAVVLKIVNAALNTEKNSIERSEGSVLVDLSLEFSAREPVGEPSGGQMDLGNTAGWITSLELFQSALSSGDFELQAQSLALINDGLNQYGSVTPPSKYDRPMQWAFILCIPFGFYYFWVYGKMSAKAKTYHLDDEGTLTTPEGIWTAEEIIDIDMSRWIATTGNARETWKAKAVTNDGQTIVLDDYIFENMHLIIGSLAHKFYPKQWTPIAKRVKVEELESVDQQVEKE